MEGINISQKTRSLYLYLQTAQNTLNEEQLNNLMHFITPNTYLESLFKVDAHIYLHHFSALLDILKGEDKVKISKILKSKWFFNTLVEKIPANELVNVIFAKTSLVIRLKIINKLIKFVTNVPYGNDLFDAYYNKYGLHASKQLLPLCSSDKVQNVLATHKISLKESLIKKLLQKDITLSSVLIKYNNITMQFVAEKDLETLWYLIENDVHPRIHLGRKQTHKLITVHKDVILCNPAKYNMILKDRQLMKSLGSDFQLYYEKSLSHHVNSVNDLNTHICFNHLKHYSKNQRLHIFSESIAHLYNATLFDCIKFINEFMLDLINDLEVRHTLAEMKYKESKQDYKFLPYFVLEKSLPLIKEKIALNSDPSIREHLIKLLVKTCKINKNESALLDVLVYILKRHRNDFYVVRNAVIHQLHDSYKIETLSAAHWKSIDEIMQLFDVNRENCPDEMKICESRILYYLHNNLPIGDLLLIYLKKFATTDRFKTGIQILGKTCMVDGFRMLPKVIDDNKTLARVCVELFLSMTEWNNKSDQKNQINTTEFLPLVLEFANILIQENKCLDHLFKHFILSKNWQPFFSLYWTQNPSSLSVAIVQYLLKHSPSNVVENIEKFSSPEFYSSIKDTHQYYSLMHVCRKYEHLDIPQNLITRALAELRNTQSECRNKSAIILSFLMNSNDYCNLISEFYPEESHHNLKCDVSTNLYQLRHAISKSLKNLTIPSVALHSVLYFTTGDYLKFSLQSLYSTFCNTAEDKLFCAVDHLLKKPVSVNKHGLYLSAFVLGEEYFIKLIANQAKIIQNPSLQVHLFKVTYKYFCKSPNNDLFELMKLFAKQLNKNDLDSFTMLVDINKVTKGFRAPYIEFAWDLIEGATDCDAKIYNLRFELLQYVDESTINILSQEFCTKIISKYHMKETYEKYLNKFVVCYLLCNNSVEVYDKRLQVVFTVVEVRKNMNLNSETKFLNSFGIFIDEFCSYAAEINTAAQLVMDFKQNCFKYVDLLKLFDRYLKLELLFLHCDSINNYLEEFSLKVASFLTEVATKYGSAAIMNYLNLFDVYLVNELVYSVAKTTLLEHTLKLFVHLCDISTESIIFIVVIYLVENLGYIEAEVEEIYNLVISKLKARTEPAVQICLYEYLRKQK